MNGIRKLCSTCKWYNKNGRCEHPDRETDVPFKNVIDGTRCGPTRKQWEEKEEKP